jgi:hypothetical protein
MIFMFVDLKKSTPFDVRSILIDVNRDVHTGDLRA